MLSVAEDYILALNPNAKLVVFGQEINPESYAICKSDMLIKGQDVSKVKFGNTFTNDGLAGETFDYMLSNPPFGVAWKKVQAQIKREDEAQGYAGRFGAGLPRISDGRVDGQPAAHIMCRFSNRPPNRTCRLERFGSPVRINVTNYLREPFALNK